MKKQVIILMAAALVSINTFAQNWPADPEKRSKAETNYTLFTDYSKQGDYTNAIVPLRWLLANTPDLHKSVYVNGANVFEGLAEKATDEKTKTGLQDSAMMMYDWRVKYFNDEANVLNRKGLKAWSYWQNRPDKLNELYTLYNRIIELNAEKSYSVVMYATLDLACKKKTKGELSDDQVIEVYEKLSELADKVIATGQKVDEWEKAKDQNDHTLTSCVKVDCNFVLTNLGPKFKENPADLGIAKKIFALMRSGGCTKDPLFLQAAEAINEKEPSMGMAMTIARFAEVGEDWAKALKFYKIVLETAKDDETKGNTYYRMANIYSRQGQKATARDFARKSLGVNPGRKDVYVLIGDLYYNSYNDCKGNDEIKSRACYLAAYEMYDKAGDASKKAMAKAQFPTMEQIFTYAMKEGDPIQTGCWIGETVVLRKR